MSPLATPRKLSLVDHDSSLHLAILQWEKDAGKALSNAQSVGTATTVLHHSCLALRSCELFLRHYLTQPNL